MNISEKYRKHLDDHNYDKHFDKFIRNILDNSKASPDVEPLITYKDENINKYMNRCKVAYYRKYIDEHVKNHDLKDLIFTSKLLDHRTRRDLHKIFADYIKSVIKNKLAAAILINAFELITDDEYLQFDYDLLYFLSDFDESKVLIKFMKLVNEFEKYLVFHKRYVRVTLSRNPFVNALMFDYVSKFFKNKYESCRHFALSIHNLSQSVSFDIDDLNI